jgi:type I site-specific restriction endonuclease
METDTHTASALSNRTNQQTVFTSALTDPEKAKKLAAQEKKQKEREAQQAAFAEEQQRYLESLKNDDSTAPDPDQTPAAQTSILKAPDPDQTPAAQTSTPTKPWQKKKKKKISFHIFFEEEQRCGKRIKTLAKKDF